MTDVDPKSPAPSTVDGTKPPEGNAEGEPAQFNTQGPSGQPFPPPNFAFYNYPPGHPPPGEAPNQDPNAPPGNGEQMPYPPHLYPYVYSKASTGMYTML
jgi:hypothetical protein